MTMCPSSLNTRELELPMWSSGRHMAAIARGEMPHTSQHRIITKMALLKSRCFGNPTRKDSPIINCRINQPPGVSPRLAREPDATA